MKTLNHPTGLKFTLFAFFLGVCFAGALKAQDCKYATDEMDKATNKMTKITKKKSVWDVPFASEGKMSMAKIGDDYSMDFLYEPAMGKGGFVVNQGAELSFQLADGTEVKLAKVKETYPITKEQLDLLLKSKVVVIRFYYTELKTGNYTHPKFYTPTNKEADTIMKLVKCVY